MLCPECGGTGEYVGLNKVESCRTCLVGEDTVDFVQSAQIRQNKDSDVSDEPLTDQELEYGKLLVEYLFQQKKETPTLVSEFPSLWVTLSTRLNNSCFRPLRQRYRRELCSAITEEYKRGSPSIMLIHEKSEKAYCEHSLLTRLFHDPIKGVVYYHRTDMPLFGAEPIKLN